MTTKHTPGPWTYNETHNVIEGRSNVCPVVGSIFQVNQDFESNARLIAAAPELLDALKALLEDVEYAQPQIEGGLIGNRQIRKARAAIEKAEGVV